MTQVTWVLKSLGELTPHALHAIMRLRQEVFMIEQACLYLDADQYDVDACHLMGYTHDHQELIAYLRAIPLPENRWKIGRVLIKKSARSTGLGKRLMKECHTRLLQRGAEEITLTSQCYAEGFYQRLGYCAEGPPFMFEGIMHRVMTRSFCDPFNNVKHLIFDLDGTIIDSADDYTTSFQMLAKELAPERPLPEPSTIRDMMFAGLQPQLEYTLGTLDEKAFFTALLRFRELCLLTPLVHTRAYPNARDSLEELKRRGFQLSICTNRPEDLALQVLQRLDLDHFFDVIVGGDRGLERKPNPEMLHYLLEQSPYSASETVMIGDSGVDAKAAQEAGCLSILVEWGYTPVDRLPSYMPTKIIKVFKDLIRILPILFILYMGNDWVVRGHTQPVSTTPQARCQSVEVAPEPLKALLSTLQIPHHSQSMLWISLWAPWCEPCLKEAHHIAQSAHKNAEQLIWIRVHGDSDQALISELDSLPLSQRGIFRSPDQSTRAALLKTLGAQGYGLPLHLKGRVPNQPSLWCLIEGTLLSR